MKKEVGFLIFLVCLFLTVTCFAKDFIVTVEQSDLDVMARTRGFQYLVNQANDNGQPPPRIEEYVQSQLNGLVRGAVASQSRQERIAECENIPRP